MAISTNGTVLARLAGALYNTQMSNATYKEVAALDPSALADVLYVRDFSASTDAAVATTLVTNLGLASVTGLDNWVAAQLTAAGSHKGAKIVELLNSFAQMTADTTYGAYATAFNAKVDNALALSQTADNAGGTFEAAGVIGGKTFTLTAGTDNLTGTAGNDTFTAILQGAGASGTTIQPGDAVSGGAGTDSLSITVAGSGGGAYTLPAVRTESVESILVSNFDTDAGATTVAADLMTGVTTVGLSSSGADGDTVFTGMKNMVAAEMRNGAGDLTLTYNGAQIVTGTADSQSLTVSNLSAGTFTADGIEAISITSETAKSTLAAVASNALKSVTVTGAADLKITGALNFASNGTATAPGAVVDASAFTGKLEITTTASEVLNAKGGSGDDTFNLGSLTKDDAIVGGAGADTINLAAASLTTQFAKVSGIEKVAFTAGTAIATMDVSKLSAGVTTVQMDLSDATDGTAALITGTFSNLDGQAIVLKHTVSNAEDANRSDGVGYTITNKVDTAADTVNVTLDAIGMTSTAAATNFGVVTLDVANFETVNLTSKKSTTVTANEVRSLTDSSATAINITGDADLTITQTGTKVTKVDASALTGKLNVTLGSNKVAVTGGSKDDTFVFAGNLNNDDTVVGGDGKDALTADASGLTATTGKLNISGVETVTLTTAGDNTLDLTGVVGADEVSVSANVQTITGLNLATKLVATANATLKVTAADATGTNGTLTVEQKVDGNVTNVIEGKAIENLSLILNDTAATVNNATFTVSAFEGSTITVTEAATNAATGTTVALGNLHKNVTSLNTSGVKGTQSASAAASTTAVTFTLAGAAVATVTGSDYADTFNIASTGGVAHAITGGTGTDTTNIAVKAGWENPSDIATENLNITVTAGDDITLAAGEAFNAATTAITVAGGNSLSTFSTLANANTVLADAVKTFDASSFVGNITVSVANDKLDETVTITGGAIATDSVTATLATAGTYKPKTVAVESLLITADNGATTAASFVLDMSSSTGVKTVVATVGDADTMTVDKVTDQLIQVVSASATTAAATIEAKLVDATGSADSVSFDLKDAATNIAAGIKLKTTDVETVNIKVSSAESISLADVSIAAADKFASLVLTGDKALTISALNADVNVINASGMATGGSVVQTGRSGTTAATYTGSAGADTFIMANTADVIAAGEGSDTLDINLTAVLGGIVVDLSATDVVVQANGSLNTTIQSGFINVDLAGYAGGYGAVVTANKAGSTITGTGATDQITGGAGADTVVATAGNDIVAAGEGNDTLEFTTAVLADNSGTTTTYNGEAGTADVLKLTTIGTTVADADFRGVTNVEVLTLATGNNTIGLGALATSAGITTVNYSVGDQALNASGLGAAAPVAINGFTLDAAGDVLNFGGTAAAGNVAITDWTITAGVYTKTGATVADFYAAIAGAANLDGEVGAFVSGGNTYIFAEGATTAATDDSYVVLMGIVATSVSATHGAAVAHIG